MAQRKLQSAFLLIGTRLHPLIRLYLTKKYQMMTIIHIYHTHGLRMAEGRLINSWEM